MYQTLRQLLALLMLAGSSAWSADHCVILQYRQISDQAPGVVSVTPAQFQQHLDHLHDNEHAVMPLEAVVDALRDGSEFPERCVALTIDNAYLSTYFEAYPRVRRYEFPLTVFVSTQVIDQGRDGFADWEQLREMQAEGIRFQNHSHSHDHLIRHLEGESQDDWEQRVASDIQLAQNRIGQELGVRPRLFAYPHGEYNQALKQIVLSMGLTAFGRQSGPVWRQADLGALPRFAMTSLSARMRSFPLKVLSLPLPITGAFPDDPVVAIDDWRPTLTLVFRPGVENTRELACRLNGSPEVIYQWLEQPAGAVAIAPRGRLNPGRNRSDCTLPIGDGGRVGWYSHNWIRRHADGSWYRSEPWRVVIPAVEKPVRESLRDRPGDAARQ